MVYNADLHEIGGSSLKAVWKSIAPNAALSGIVDRYFVLINEVSGHDSSSYILPDNSAHLIFYLFEYDSRVVPTWTVIGPRSTHQIINRKNRLFTFVCTFKPGGIRQFINVPVNEIRDLPVNSSELVRNYDPVLFEQLTRDAMRFDIVGFIKHLETFLCSSVASTHPVVRVFFEKLSNEGCALKGVSKELGYSDRQLRNLIQSNIGHSPKMVQQIERFARSLRLRKSNDNWASIAHSSGYYDQSHMIGDYQKLVGMSPERLLF